MDVESTIVLMVLAAMMIGGMVAGFFVLIALAAFTYVWTQSYPWLKMVGKFVARPANFFSLGILYVLLLVAFIVAVIAVFAQLSASPTMLTYLLLLLVLALIPVLLIIYILVALGLVVWIVRVVKWLFAHWRGLLEGVYFSTRLQIIRLKIKADMMQETSFRGSSGGSVRGSSGGGARRSSGSGGGARGGPSTRFTTGKTGKKGASFKEKLEALRREFAGDVQRARSKLFRRRR